MPTAIGRTAELPTFDEYTTWLENAFDINVRREQNYYEMLCPRLAKDFEQSAVWQDLQKEIDDIDDRYLIGRKTKLIREWQYDIVTKPYSSFLDKTFRKNIRK